MTLLVLLLSLYAAVGYLLWRTWPRKVTPPAMKTAHPEPKLTPEALVAERDRLRERLRDMPGYGDLSPMEQSRMEERIMQQGARLLGGVRR